MAARGLRVLLVDYDPQAHATISVGAQKLPDVYDVIVREMDIASVRLPVGPERYLPPGAESKGCLHLLAGNGETHGIPVQTDNDRALAEALEDAQLDYDLAIIDSAPSAGLLLKFAWLAADYVVIPAKMEFLSLDGIAGTLTRAKRSGVAVLGVLPNLFEPQTNLHNKYYEQLQRDAKSLGLYLFSPVHKRIAWAEASAVQHSLISLEGQVGSARVEAVRFVDQLEKRMEVQYA
jgi:chromosome partitioning protein